MAIHPHIVPDDEIEFGEKEDIESDFLYRNNVHQANIKVRHGFLRKVYLILFSQLTLTTALGFTVACWPQGRMYIHNSDWLISLSFILSVVSLIALHIKRHHYPVNFILLGLFTFVEAYTVAVLVTYFDQLVVLQALFLTVAVVAGLTLYTFQSKRDFSSLGIGLYVCTNVLFFGIIFHLLFPSTQFEIAVSIFGAILFSLFIIYDTQNMMKRLSAEEYIVAAITLYLDIINLFLYILRALQSLRRQ